MDFVAMQAKLKAMGLSFLNPVIDYAATLNSTAILAALIGGWIVGWIWYALVGTVWQDSVGTGKANEFSPRRQIFGGLAQIIMTIMLGSFMTRLNYTGAWGGIHTAWLLWFGFVMTTILVNYANLGKKLGLAFIDGIHWLLVLTAMGVIIGTFNDLGIGVQKAQAGQPAVAPAAAAATVKTGG